MKSKLTIKNLGENKMAKKVYLNCEFCRHETAGRFNTYAVCESCKTKLKRIFKLMKNVRWR